MIKHLGLEATPIIIHETLHHIRWFDVWTTLFQRNWNEKRPYIDHQWLLFAHGLGFANSVRQTLSGHIDFCSRDIIPVTNHWSADKRMWTFRGRSLHTSPRFLWYQIMWVRGVQLRQIWFHPICLAWLLLCIYVQLSSVGYQVMHLSAGTDFRRQKPDVRRRQVSDV